MNPDTIVDIVLNTSGASGFDTNAGDFDLLREALIAADLVAPLADANGDFSVFAPTDGAFIGLARDLGADVADGDEAAALSAIVAALTELAGSEAGGIELLKTVLLYHVAPGARDLATLDAAGPIATLANATLEVDGTTVIDQEPERADPMVAIQDIQAANGTIQAIDGVLLPLDLASNETIVSVASKNDQFEILVKALSAAGLVDTLAAAEDLTVFAPTDGAFAALAFDLGYTGRPGDVDAVFNHIAGVLTELGGGDPIPLLTDILLYHVSPGAKSAAEIGQGANIENLNGAALSAEGAVLNDQDPDAAHPEIVLEDVAAGSNLIQAVDKVLRPIDIPTPGRVEGSDVADTFEGGSSNDLMIGRRGADTIDGGAGDDQLRGNKGRDELYGGEGADLLKGGKGSDELFAGAGDDIARGGRQGDMIKGGGGDDILHGGHGADTLSGDGGDDKLSGGRGADAFDFTNLAGDDIVRDFGGRDRAIFDAEDFHSGDALRDSAVQIGANVVVETDDGASVTFQDTTIDALHDGALIFL